MSFLIDGYNLMHAIKACDELFAPVDDVTLCERIEYYLQKTSTTGTVVFDGIGPPDKRGLHNSACLSVIFSGAHIEADTVIEHKIDTCKNTAKLTVVSNDRRLRNAAKNSKAVSMLCIDFWNAVQTYWCAPCKKTEPPAKQQGLNQHQTNQWLDIFGIND